MSSRAASSAHLGATLRTVLLAPRAGFESALKTTRRRKRLNKPRPEGIAPYVLSVVGGAAAALLWLKVSPLVGMRVDSPLYFRWQYLVVAAVLGALVMVVGQFIWGAVGPLVLRPLEVEADGRELRLVWGASAFPQVFALFLLVPIDLAIVGPAAFMNVRVEDTVSGGWAALSVALALAIALWSVWVFVRGMQVAGGVSAGRALLSAGPALLCFLGLVFVLRVAAISLAGALT